MLRGPVGLSILFGLVCEVSIIARGPESLTGSGHFWSISIPFTCLLEVANAAGTVVTSCWLGMWFGIRGHSPLATMARAAGLTTGIPFLFKTLSSFGLAMPIGRLFGYDIEIWMKLGWAMIIVVLFYYVWLIRRTHRHPLVELSGTGPTRA